MLTLNITAPTAAKAALLPLLELQDEQKVQLVPGQSFKIPGYGMEAQHLEVDVFLWEEHWKLNRPNANWIEIEAATDAIAKFSPAQSSKLPANAQIPCPKGTRIQVPRVFSDRGHWRFPVYIWHEHCKADSPPKKLQLSDFERIAHEMNCSVAAVRAVVAIESAGSGFLADGRPKILFEAHHFGRLTNHRYGRSHPHLSSRRWNRSLYVGGAREWDRMEEAISLNRDAAWMSASWGLGQVMGFNYRICGYSSIETFVEAMERSEGDQLNAMFGFIESNGLARHLRSRDWVAFARGYNGRSFRANRYDIKLANAYRKYSSN